MTMILILLIMIIIRTIHSESRLEKFGGSPLSGNNIFSVAAVREAGHLRTRTAPCSVVHTQTHSGMACVREIWTRNRHRIGVCRDQCTAINGVQKAGNSFRERRLVSSW